MSSLTLCHLLINSVLCLVMNRGAILIDNWVLIGAIISGGASFLLVCYSYFSGSKNEKSWFYYSISLVYLASIIVWMFSEKTWSLVISIIIVLTLIFNALRKNLPRGKNIDSGNIIYNCLILLILLSLTIVVEYKIVMINWRIVFDFVIGTSLVFSIFTFFNTLLTLFKSRIRKTPHLSDAETPTVSLLIAARNEDHALMECLNAAISSNYPKLEIIVLDDCSQDGTGNIIREFAKHGVRFIPGKEPSDQWLGRNHAFSQLADEAAGDYMVFMDVDVKLSPDTLNRMIKFSEIYGYEMISVNPQQQHLDVLPMLLQPLNLLWQTTFRQIIKRPPMNTSFWAIKRQSLFELGGFESHPGDIYPELKFAASLHAIDTYFFCLANADDNVSIRKRISSLWERAERSYYPNLKFNPAYVTLLSLLIIAAIALPLMGSWDLLVGQSYLPGNIGGLAAMAFWLSAHLILVTRVSPSAWFLSILNLPLVVLIEIYLLVRSMLGYETNSIIWKNRPVCFK